MTDDGSDGTGYADAGGDPGDGSGDVQDGSAATGSGGWGAVDSGDPGQGDGGGYGDAANSMVAWQDPSGGGAEEAKARVVGWYASCMFVDTSSQRCRFMQYSAEQDGANAAAASHKQGYPDHANAVVVTQSS